MPGLIAHINRLTVTKATDTAGAAVESSGAVSPRQDSVTGRLPDFSNNGNRGVLNTGRYITFDGTNDYLESSSSINGIRTIAFWLNHDTANEKILDLGGGIEIEIVANRVTTSGLTGDVSYVNDAETDIVVDGTWQLVVVSTDTAFNMTSLDMGRISASFYGYSLSYLRFYSERIYLAQATELYDYPEKIKPNRLAIPQLKLFLPFFEENTMNTWLISGLPGSIPAQLPLGAATLNTGAAEPAPQAAVLQQQTRLRSSFAYLNIPDDPKLKISGASANWSLAVRIFFISLASPKGVMAKGALNSEYSLTVQGGALSFRGGSATAITHSISANNIYNVLCTVSGGTTATMYVNGTQVATGSITAAATGTGDLQINAYASGNIPSALTWYGALWDATLTDDDATTLATGVMPTRVGAGNLIGCWMNDGTTTWKDRSGYGNDATVTGTTNNFQDIQGYAKASMLGLPFETERQNRLLLRDSGHVSVADDNTLDATTALTIECWVNIGQTGKAQQFMLKTDAYGVEVQADDTVRFSIWQTTEKTTDTTTTISAGVWYHICCTYDGTDSNIYIDGQLDTTSDTHSGNIDSTANALLIGASDTSLSNTMTGDIGMYRVYTTALTALEVSHNFRKNKRLYNG